MEKLAEKKEVDKVLLNFEKMDAKIEELAEKMNEAVGVEEEDVDDLSDTE